MPTKEADVIAPTLREIEALAKLYKTQTETYRTTLARLIDQARSEGLSWVDISEAIGGEGPQYAYNLRRRLPDPE